MMILSEKQLNNLNKEALIIIVTSLQNQLGSVHEAEVISDSSVPEPEISEVIISSYRRKNLFEKGMLTSMDFHPESLTIVSVVP